MKTKFCLNFLMFVSVFVFFSCGSDDNSTNPPPSSIPGATNTEFVIGTDAYVTPNAYLLLNDATGDHERDFTFVFSSETVIEDATNEIAIETSTDHFIKLTADLVGTVATEPELPIFVWPTQNLPLNVVLEGEHFAHTDIQGYTNLVTVGGIDYGQVNNSTMYTHADLALTDHSHPTHLFTINSITWDLVARTGMIDCSYNIDDDNNVNIQGTYVGTFEILVGY